MAEIVVAASVLSSFPMPQVCARTGEPTTRTRAMQATWVPLWAYALLAGGLIPFAIVYFAVAKRVRARVPVSRSVSRRRSLGMVLVVVAALPFLAGLIGVLTEPTPGVAALFLASAGALAGGVALQTKNTVRLRWRGDDIRFTRVHPAFAAGVAQRLDVLRARSLAGWHPDPAGAPALRYYDGTRWTEHLSPANGAPW
jgi:hypothetical protein